MNTHILHVCVCVCSLGTPSPLLPKEYQQLMSRSKRLNQLDQHQYKINYQNKSIRRKLYYIFFILCLNKKRTDCFWSVGIHFNFPVFVLCSAYLQNKKVRYNLFGIVKILFVYFVCVFLFFFFLLKRRLYFAKTHNTRFLFYTYSLFFFF